MRLLRALPLFALVVSGCAGRGLLTDGSSISVGSFNEGLLRRGRALPPRGEGYAVPELWKKRGASYGTDELAGAIAHAARRVRREYPGGTLGIGDLSPKGGGDSELHRSHENGRDADLIWYAVDTKDRPVAPADAMPRYGADLRARPPAPDPRVNYGSFSPRRFDVRRNWALIRALVQDPRVDVQYLFCHAQLKQRLLEHAQSIGEDPDVIDRAAALLHQPGDSMPHDDHLHLRIFCSSDDRPFGCVDRGPVRWWKKRYKYMAPGRALDLSELLARLVVNPFPGLRRFVP